MESKVRHLEMIQNIITRMAQNSFWVKGTAITLISAILIAVQVIKLWYVTLVWLNNQKQYE